ncbi:hypothetical protein [Streptomyces sp. AC550_RSS872]|uniref:hypothetical protein n=1 Tax=Streptomyces sp. AC550_RSS872 TaxID=2823689 RepID=UPI001C25B203|nr:hypothetical protein [Streptomyces sp. AC550_RSS872]
MKDPDAAVRLEAVRVPTETAPPGAGPALARDLAEVLPVEQELRATLVSALAVADPKARSVALDVLSAPRLGDATLFAGAPGLPGRLRAPGRRTRPGLGGRGRSPVGGGRGHGA